MVKFTSKSEVAQACMTAIHYNKLRTKISNKKYAKLVKTVEAGYKNGTIESVWKSFKEHKQHMNKREYKQLKKDVKDFVYPECTICCDKNCMENHCTMCKGRDKMVCRGCILKMTKIDEGINLCYKCPYCNTGMQPGWFKNDNAAFARLDELIRKQIQENSTNNLSTVENHGNITLDEVDENGDLRGFIVHGEVSSPENFDYHDYGPLGVAI